MCAWREHPSLKIGQTLYRDRETEKISVHPRLAAQKSAKAIYRNGVPTAVVTEQIVTVNLKPPSVNHYWRFVGRGKWVVTEEGKRFKEAIAIFSRTESGPSVLAGRTEKEIATARYCIEVWVYLGRKAKGDGDNMWKGILDGLKDAGCIHSDKGTAVIDSYMHVREQRERDFTETVISVRWIEGNWLGLSPASIPGLVREVRGEMER